MITRSTHSWQRSSVPNSRPATSIHDPRLYHLREEHGRKEVDLVRETADGRIVGIEV